MTSYTIEFNDGRTSDGCFDRDSDAQAWVEAVLEQHGCDASEIVSGDWDAAGSNDDGSPLERMLFWADEEASNNDSGANAICQLVRAAR